VKPAARNPSRRKLLGWQKKDKKSGKNIIEEQSAESGGRDKPMQRKKFVAS